MKLFKKNPEELTVGEALIYLVLITIISFLPLFGIIYHENIEEAGKKLVNRVKSKFKKEA